MIRLKGDFFRNIQELDEYDFDFDPDDERLQKSVAEDIEAFFLNRFSLLDYFDENGSVKEEKKSDFNDEKHHLTDSECLARDKWVYDVLEHLLEKFRELDKRVIDYAQYQ